VVQNVVQWKTGLTGTSGPSPSETPAALQRVGADRAGRHKNATLGGRANGDGEDQARLT
jgi:hypothetical protein